MPNMQGNELLEKIRVQDNDSVTPIVMLSSVEKESIVDACKSLGILGYILKPIKRGEAANVFKEFLVKAGDSLTAIEA